MRRYAHPIGPSLVFVATFATLVVAGAVGMRHVPGLAFARQQVPPIPSIAPWVPVFVAGGAQLDHTLLWNDVDGSIANARRADVLFVGSSRLQFALPPHALSAFAKSSGLHMLSIAVPGGGWEFPLALIEKYDLRPRLVVAEIDAFQATGALTEFRRVRDADRWAGFTEVWEARLAGVAWSIASPALPSFVTPRPSQVLLRSSENGAWWPIGWPHRHARVDLRKGKMRWHTATARQFQAALAARGTQLVLTCVPATFTPCDAVSARPLATALRAPGVFPGVERLWAMDLTHLCPLSGKRYGRALTNDLRRLDVVRALARERRATRLARASRSADAVR